MQVGDFGYWEHHESGKWFLEHLSRRAVAADMPFYWIDGNHENHVMLRRLYGPGGSRHKPTPEGFWEIRPNVFYIPRATKWEWDGATFMGVGGAHSIDRDWRLSKETSPHTLWWPNEVISPGEAERAIGQGKVDVLFTHDCPTNAPFLHRIKNDPESHIHRQLVTEIGRSACPKIWFHGHMHEFYNYEFMHEDGYARVIGLECNGMPHNWAWFDTVLLTEAPES